jgi:hypothetical protein
MKEEQKQRIKQKLIDAASKRAQRKIEIEELSAEISKMEIGNERANALRKLYDLKMK